MRNAGQALLELLLPRKGAKTATVSLVYSQRWGGAGSLNGVRVRAGGVA